MNWPKLGTASFTALDFETANPSRDSACAVGLVRVDRGRITKREHFLIRPPSSRFEFTHIHGITYKMVQNAPTFADHWPRLAPYLNEVDFVAAHNSAFDASVLRATCAHYGIAFPNIEFQCTVDIARRRWGLYPTKLPDVARFLGIELQHHNAASDAEACARIVIAAAGRDPSAGRERRADTPIEEQRLPRGSGVGALVRGRNLR